LPSGRTARIGNEGLASSFYNNKDEPIAEALVKILLESGQEIPDFLADRKPAEGELLVFDDDSGADDDEEEGTGKGDDAWGGGDGTANGEGGDGGDAWSSVKPAAVALAAGNDDWDANNDKGGW
jgi:ATP-dependent RNA helicase DDX3X